MNPIGMAANNLREDEGKRLTFYRDHRGNLTFGIGHKVDGRPLPDIAIEAVFAVDLLEHAKWAAEIVPRFAEHSEGRQALLIEMCFNLGPRGLRGFRKMLEALNAKDYERAAAEIVDSAAFRDNRLRPRYQRFADRMRG